MNPWYQLLVNKCESEHDRECFYGADCHDRDNHIQKVYVHNALRVRVNDLQARLAAVENLADVYDRSPDALDAQDAAKDIRKAARGE